MTTFRRDTATWWADGFDLLLTPTCLRPAPTLGEMAPDNDDLMGCRSRPALFAADQPFNVTGQPRSRCRSPAAVRVSPIGLQFVAPYAREDLLLRSPGSWRASTAGPTNGSSAPLRAAEAAARGSEIQAGGTLIEAFRGNWRISLASTM